MVAKLLADGAVICPDSTKFYNSARAAGAMGLASISLPESFRPRRSSLHPVGEKFFQGLRFQNGFEIIAIARVLVSTSAS